MKIPLSLGRDHAERKRLPIMRVLGYFTAAIAGLTRHAVRGNDQHNPGQALHWARGKSTDHAECVGRHSFDLMDLHAWLERNPNHPERGSVLTELEHEYDARLWRAAADSQEFYEKHRGAPVSPSSVLPVDPPGLPVMQELMAKGAALAPLIDYSHEIAPDRLVFPPALNLMGGIGIVFPYLWQGESSGRWYFDTTDFRSSTSFATEAEARAAYWQWKDAQ